MHSPKKEGPTKWQEKAPTHLRHLLGTVSIHMTDDQIQQIITPNSKFETATDGGHDPTTGISTYGWVAAINKQIIAKGNGPAQAHPSMAESFRAEGYGLTSACLFITNLIRKFNIQQNQHSWVIYIDSKSLIQRMESYRTRTNIPRWNLRPDEDICKVALDLLRKLQIQIQHIKSHQDQKTSIDKLPFEAVLNTMADKEATRQRNLMTTPDSNVQILGAAQLRINDIAITRDSHRWLMHTAGKIPIQQYYKERLGWSPSTFDHVSWDTQLAVLRRYNQDDQARIIKFVHGWLPTQHRKFKEGTALSPRCQLCSSLIEDNDHLFKCQHRKMTTVQSKIQQHLLGQLQEYGDSEIINILDIGLTESLANNDWEPDTRNISRKWREGVLAQNKIGWNQIYNGRFATSLIKSMDQHYRTMDADPFKYTGESWARHMIQTIWNTMLALWQTRNEIMNAIDAKQKEQQKKERLEKRVRRCFGFKEILQHAERLRWFSDTADEILKKDARFIETWTKAVERIITITKREQKKRPKESIIMERFFNIRTISNTINAQPQRSAKVKLRKFIQELKPD
jgi:ribonuclease HI